MLAFSVLAGCGGAEVSPGDGPAPGDTSAPVAPARFTLRSPAFAENARIPTEYSCTGRNVAPPLRWQHVPAGAESLAVVVEDPDAPAGRYVHWVVSGIPPTTTEIVDGVLPPTAVVSLNSGNKADYLGPCPPAGTGLHHYRFQLYALRKPVSLAPTTPVPESTLTITEMSIAVATTVGVFGE